MNGRMLLGIMAISLVMASGCGASPLSGGASTGKPVSTSIRHGLSPDTCPQGLNFTDLTSPGQIVPVSVGSPAQLGMDIESSGGDNVIADLRIEVFSPGTSLFGKDPNLANQDLPYVRNYEFQHLSSLSHLISVSFDGRSNSGESLVPGTYLVGYYIDSVTTPGAACLRGATQMRHLYEYGLLALAYVT